MVTFLLGQEWNPIKKRSSLFLKQRAVIEFLTAKGVVPVEIHRRKQIILSNSCVMLHCVALSQQMQRWRNWNTGIM